MSRILKRFLNLRSDLRLVYDRNHYFGLGPIPKPKPNFLPNIRYFQIIFEDLGLFSNFKKLVSLQEVGKNLKLEKKKWKKRVSVWKKHFCTDTKIGPWFRFPIPKPGFGCTLLYSLHYKPRYISIQPNFWRPLLCFQG